MPHHAAGTQGSGPLPLAEHAALLDEAGQVLQTVLGDHGLIERPHQLRRRHFAAALRRFPHKGRSVSKRMVTGPSFRESTCISAPNSPC